MEGRAGGVGGWEDGELEAEGLSVSLAFCRASESPSQLSETMREQADARSWSTSKPSTSSARTLSGFADLSKFGRGSGGGGLLERPGNR